MAEHKPDPEFRIIGKKWGDIDFIPHGIFKEKVTLPKDPQEFSKLCRTMLKTEGLDNFRAVFL